MPRLDARWDNFWQRGQIWYHFDQDSSSTSVENTGSLTAGAIILAIRQTSTTADAVVLTSAQATVTSNAIVWRLIQSSMMVDAFVQPYFRAGAWIIVGGQMILGSLPADAIFQMEAGASLVADAYIVGLTRTQHDRGTPPHYDNDFDSVIVLAKSIDVYQQGMDLHAALTAIVGRVSDLESGL